MADAESCECIQTTEDHTTRRHDSGCRHYHKTVKAILITSDPYEPSGVIGLFETEEQRLAILEGYIAKQTEWYREYMTGSVNEAVLSDLEALKYIEIPIGVYGKYY